MLKEAVNELEVQIAILRQLGCISIDRLLAILGLSLQTDFAPANNKDYNDVDVAAEAKRLKSDVTEMDIFLEGMEISFEIIGLVSSF